MIDKIFNENCLDTMARLPDNSIDAITTDPPYGINFMNVSFDKAVPTTDIWQECLRVLKPGAHMLVACGTRTYHKMATNIEDAGFEIRDIIIWAYGSGMPKSLNISKALDQELKCERKVTGKKLNSLGRTPGGGTGWAEGITTGAPRSKHVFNVTTPSSDEAKQYDGWGTNLTPSVELWCLARKPISESTIAKNVLKWGTAGINIDGTRISTEDSLNGGGYSENFGGSTFQHQKSKTEFNQPTGRWPKNLIISDDPEVRDLFPETGKSKASGYNFDSSNNDNVTHITKSIKSGKHYDGEGSAARFFKSVMTENDTSRDNCVQFSKEKHQFNYGEENNTSASRFFYCAKSSKSEKNAGMAEGTKNVHPTVKPLALMKYLVRLITPPNGVVYDPFSGSGTTLVAAINEGFNWIGSELSQEYCEIARQRISHCQKQIQLSMFGEAS
jgi:site-specific DNA-methyltransferase (adenine-specific)